MILYDYLFYCSYKMGMRSNNFNGLPVLAGMMMVIPNMGAHLIIVQFILKCIGIVWLTNLMRDEVWGRIFYLVFFSGVYWSYWYKDRYKRIIEKYNLGKNTYWKRHPFVTILLYTIITIIVFFIAGNINHIYFF